MGRALRDLRFADYRPGAIRMNHHPQLRRLLGAWTATRPFSSVNRPGLTPGDDSSHVRHIINRRSVLIPLGSGQSRRVKRGRGKSDQKG